jgi:hypothetical protein
VSEEATVVRVNEEDLENITARETRREHDCDEDGAHVRRRFDPRPPQVETTDGAPRDDESPNNGY